MEQVATTYLSVFPLDPQQEKKKVNEIMLRADPGWSRRGPGESRGVWDVAAHYLDNAHDLFRRGLRAALLCVARG